MLKKMIISHRSNNELKLALESKVITFLCRFFDESSRYYVLFVITDIA